MLSGAITVYKVPVPQPEDGSIFFNFFLHFVVLMGILSLGKGKCQADVPLSHGELPFTFQVQKNF